MLVYQSVAKLAAVGLLLLLPLVARADLAAESAGNLSAALQSGQADTVKLTWTIGRGGEAQDHLRIDGGRASLQRCTDPGSCQPIGAALPLSAGQRGQLLSVLRAADLPHLRTADPESAGAADRMLELMVAWPERGAGGRWLLSRSDWPAPPDGYGVAEFLDELVRTVQKTAQARPVVAVPATVQELQALRVQLRLTPRTRPGGLITIEKGLVHVTPAEGSLPRSPPPRPWERPLGDAEQQELLRVLQAAKLDKLGEVVPKRAAPAIGDDDGRLAALHLIPESKDGTPRVEPRGIERYLADLMRSPARPLCEKLVELLLTPPSPAPATPGKGGRPGRTPAR